jgi:hypothetical protein
MRSQLFVHQKNQLSFSYTQGRLTKDNLHQYIQSKTREETQITIQHDPSVYLHNIKDGMYNLDNQRNIHTYCSLEKLRRLYYQSDSVYFYLLRNLSLNLFSSQSDNLSRNKIEYVCSTFYPEDILEINQQDYYKISIRGSLQPLFLQQSVYLFDDTGHRGSILDIVHRMGKRKVLGLNDQHEFRTFEIERVENITSEDENITELDTPFYAIGIVRKAEGSTRHNTVLINQILVELD